MVKNTVEACMFCGAVPCECNKPAPKTRAPKRATRTAKPAAAEATAPAPQPVPADDIALGEPSGGKKINVRGAMKAMAKATADAKPEPTPPVRAIDDTDVSPELASALRALDAGGILHPMEHKRFSEVLDAEPSVEERKVTWRKVKDYAQGS